MRRREGLARFGGHNRKPPQKKPTSNVSIPVETRSSKSTENSTKPSNKKTSTASASGKKVSLSYLQIIESTILITYYTMSLMLAVFKFQTTWHGFNSIGFFTFLS